MTRKAPGRYPDKGGQGVGKSGAEVRDRGPGRQRVLPGREYVNVGRGRPPDCEIRVYWIASLLMTETIMETVIDIDEARFEQEVIETSDSVLVVFRAAWCTPCRTLMPILEEVAERWSSRLRAYRVDVEEQPALAARLGARGFPTLFLFVEGSLEATRVGALSREQLEQMLEEHL